MDCRLGGWGSISGKDKTFWVLHSMQTGIGAYPVLYTLGTESSFSGVNRQVLEVNLVSGLRMMKPYLHYPLRINGVPLN
jgi:hypothetical protein